MITTTQKLESYKGRCGSCVYFKNSYKDGRQLKSGICTYNHNNAKYRASGIACQRYEEKEGTV